MIHIMYLEIGSGMDLTFSLFALFFHFFDSARYCDADESGVRYMLFCRVVMGNMELVPAGSKQSHPSNENFDSGVDDLQNPRNYIIWDMYKNTHIYPEYVVSFKVSSDGEGDFTLQVFLV